MIYWCHFINKFIVIAWVENVIFNALENMNLFWFYGCVDFYHKTFCSSIVWSTFINPKKTRNSFYIVERIHKWPLSLSITYADNCYTLNRSLFFRRQIVEYDKFIQKPYLTCSYRILKKFACSRAKGKKRQLKTNCNLTVLATWKLFPYQMTVIIGWWRTSTIIYSNWWLCVFTFIRMDMRLKIHLVKFKEENTIFAICLVCFYFIFFWQ